MDHSIETMYVLYLCMKCIVVIMYVQFLGDLILCGVCVVDIVLCLFVHKKKTTINHGRCRLRKLVA